MKNITAGGTFAHYIIAAQTMSESKEAAEAESGDTSAQNSEVMEKEEVAAEEVASVETKPEEPVKAGVNILSLLLIIIGGSS